MTNTFVFEADSATKKVHIEREFDAPVEKIWKAWTDPAILEKWWAPKPNRAVTKVMDFKVGGTWQFAMTTPEGQEHNLYAQFTAIEEYQFIATAALFLDGEGKPTTGGSKWYRDTRFSSIAGNRTKVNIDITYDDESTFEMMAKGYFKTGTEIGYNQLDELLATE